MFTTPEAAVLQSIFYPKRGASTRQLLSQTPMPRRVNDALGASLRTPETKVLPDDVHTPILQEPRPPAAGCGREIRCISRPLLFLIIQIIV